MEISASSKRAMLEAFIANLGVGVRLAMYEGTKPASIEIPVDSQVELVSLPLANPPFIIDEFLPSAALDVQSYPTPPYTGVPSFFVIYGPAEYDEEAKMMGDIITGTSSLIPNALTIEGAEITEGEPLISVELTIRY